MKKSPTPLSPDNINFTPNPLFDLIIDYKLVSCGEVFLVTGVLTEPQPISVNKMYTTFRGKRNLTAAGRAYKDGLAAVVARSSLSWKRAHEMVYHEGKGAMLLVTLYFEQLNNKSWKPGNMTDSGEMQEPRKVQDASNYIKIVEDGVKDGSGIDDCNNIEILITKAEDQLRPRTELVYIVA